MKEEPLIFCPVCQEQIDVDLQMEEGDTLNCSACDAELVIVSMHPVQVKEVSDDDEDDEDDDGLEDFRDDN